MIKYRVTQNIKKDPEQAQNYPKSSTERKQQVATFITARVIERISTQNFMKKY